MKHLILMRHGIADDHYSGQDQYKPLTEEGIRVHKQMANLLKEKGIVIEGIYHSPFLRAKQSAELLSQAYPKALLKEEAALGEIFDSFTLVKHIHKNKHQNVALVGHEPTLALFASHLMEEYKPFKLEKSACLGLDFEQEIKLGQGKLKFYLSPEDLEKNESK